MTLRVRSDVPNLRRRKYGHVIFDALHQARHRLGLRVVHFSIQPNHFHLVVEARDRRSLSRGMQGLCVRFARRLNKRIGRRGAFFADRFHARPLTTIEEARNALRYVLNNTRRHHPNPDRWVPRNWVDPYSSGDYFDGWKPLRGGVRPRAEFVLGRGPPVCTPRTWLLRRGWSWLGRIGVDEVPGERRSNKRQSGEGSRP